MISRGGLLERVSRSTFVQAARSVHAWARRGGNQARTGFDDLPSAEPVRFAASDRMRLPANDVARADTADDGKQIRITSNLLGLAGSSPALPPNYSELQLQRRRARDFAFGHFLGIFDHRALSFYYRIAEKYSWPLQAERAGTGGTDPIRTILIALAGISGSGRSDRLDLPDHALVTLVGYLADVRRTSEGVETVLRVLTGLPLRIIEAVPTWMAVPPGEQSRIGGPGAQFAQLGQLAGEEDAGMGGAALIGAAVLDVQHHYVVEVGPLSYAELQNFCCDPAARRSVAQICALASGIEQRPSLRLQIARGNIPDLRLGCDEAPAMLGWTTWISKPEGSDADPVNDCLIPLDPTTMLQKSNVA